jgi:hypothetical protein
MNRIFDTIRYRARDNSSEAGDQAGRAPQGKIFLIAADGKLPAYPCKDNCQVISISLPGMSMETNAMKRYVSIAAHSLTAIAFLNNCGATAEVAEAILFPFVRLDDKTRVQILDAAREPGHSAQSRCRSKCPHPWPRGVSTTAAPAYAVA